MRSKKGMANRQEKVYMRFELVSAPQLELSLGLAWQDVRLLAETCVGLWFIVGNCVTNQMNIPFLQQ